MAVLPYQDPGVPVEARVDDLLARMTPREKAGLLFHPPIAQGPDGALSDATERLVGDLGLSHFNVHKLADPRTTALWHNRLQRRAADTRLGIPVTLSSDPRHAFTDNPLASVFAGDFSRWPEFIGMAAARDAELVREQADIVRREYLAVGLRVALHPMADLATEPRWARISGTFGEDAHLAAQLVAAYVKGLQGDTLGPDSVAAMTKHFPGGGPQLDGEDPHFSYGREQVYPGGMFEHHLIPFEAAFAAGGSQVMPYYGLPVGTAYEEVGFCFNADVIRDLLRGRYGFDGIVCADWNVLTAKSLGPVDIEARGWGVEDLDVPDRVVKALEAGVDQFGGETCADVVVDLLESGRLAAGRVDASVRRLLREKFRLGLFDERRYVDPDAAETVVGSTAHRARGLHAQRRSIVLLTNRGETPALPLADGLRVYVERIDPDVAAAYAGKVVADPAEADVAVLRVNAPFEPREGLMESMFRQGSLEFPDAERDRLLALAAAVPTVVVLQLDRPAVATELAGACAALLADFGAEDAAVLDVVFGRHAPAGKLPFDMPSSMRAVRESRPDVPFDTAEPLFRFGYGLTY